MYFEKHSRAVLFILLMLFALPHRAQDVIMTELPNINQLPTRDILCIFQDSEGYMWYGTEEGLCRDDAYQIKVFRSDFNTPGLLENNSVTSIAEDKEGKIWFGTKRGMYILDKTNYKISSLPDSEIKGWVIKMVRGTSDGTVWVSSGKFLFRYDMSGERLGKYELKCEDVPREVNGICEDNEGTIWATQLKGGLFRYNAQDDKFVQYPWPFKTSVTWMMKDAVSPFYWIGTWGDGIVRFDPREKNTNCMFVSQSATTQYADPDKKRISCIAQDSLKHHLWVTANDNLYAYEIDVNDMLHSVDISGLFSEDKRMLNSVICDQDGNLWIVGNYPESYSFVISYLPNKIMSYPMDLVKKEIGIYASPMELFYEKEYYWVRQKRVGLYIYDTKNNKLAMHENYNRSFSFFFEKSVDYDGVYVAVFESQVILIQYTEKGFIETEICKVPIEPHERIRTLYDDKHGNLWIGTTFHLYKYELKQKQLEKVYEYTDIVNDIISLDDGSIFIATESEGFWKIVDGRKEFKYLTKENYVVLTTSPDQKVWVGTQQGNVYCYDTTKNELTSKTKDCSLIGDAIIDLLADDYGNIWILTDQTIIIYNPEKQITNSISCSDPFISLDNFLSLHKGENGEMHVGGRGGVLTFPCITPLEKVSQKISISLTSVKINNIQKILGRDSQNIILEPQERNVELFFSTFDPLNTNKICYAFRQKQDSVWNYLPMGQNSIYLAGLSKGIYEMEVRATDKNGLWTQKSTIIKIQRQPDWYETWLAYTSYLFIFLVSVLLMIQRYVRLQKAKQQKLMDEQVSQMKYRFFTNVSHELRTPLTLIVTPLETIIRKVSNADLKQQLESINKNAQDLLSLVNQLLDFRKIEMGHETLSLTKGDISEFISSIYESFQLVAREKKIDFQFHTDISSFYLFFDANKLRKVVNNLLSNAFKYTEEGGCISLSIYKRNREQEYVVISVEDTGKGIPVNELSTIFERFHQVGGQEGIIGSGIGLHIVKEYVDMHGGFVDVQSELYKGSIFSVYISTDLKPHASITAMEMEKEREKVAMTEPLGDLRKRVLIVEDNVEFSTYLKGELSRFYTVYEAANGLEGEKKAVEKEPDVIITDLMMPGIDGIELCHRIKNNINTSHIPVILLTANSNIENEERGYREGADAYISKPFHWDILLARVENLMVQKVQRQQLFKNEIEVAPKDITISSLDERLIKKALELIETNINNSEYSIEDLSSDMAMSRSNLYRKIHSITGQTPTDFIKNIRLKKAAELLKEGGLTVVEVAYTVGFNTPSYFTKSFKKMFGVLPTQYGQK